MPSRFLTPKPLGNSRDILKEASGKAASGAVMTDVFLLPFGDGGREGLGREGLPRWTALITPSLEEVEEVLFLCPSSLGLQALRKLLEGGHPNLFTSPPVD